MSKKTLSFCLLILCCAVSVFILENSLGSQSLSQLYIHPNQWNQLLSTREEISPSDTEEALFDSIYFNGYKLAFDRSTSSFLYSLIEDHPQAYDPPVRLVSSHPDAKIAFRGLAITDELIQNNDSISVIIYTDKHYASYQLRCTTLPIIEIDIPLSDITKENMQAQFSLFDNRIDVTSRMVQSSALIHLRGNYSLHYPKKDYRISLFSHSAGNNQRKNHVSLLGARQDEDWILKAMYNDKDKIREVFSTNLWYESCAAHNDFSIVNGTHYRYVELFIGQEYCGLYALCHPIDAKQTELKGNEHFYRKSSSGTAETEIDFAEKGPVKGYEYLGSNLAAPDWEPLRHYYRTLFTQEYDDPQILYEIADISNSIDIYLFLNLIQGVDHAHLRDENAVYNLFFTAKMNPDANYSILYTPWDMDRTWGLDFGERYRMNPTTHVIIDTNIVTRLLELGDARMAQLLIDRYWELREGPWSDESIENMLYALEADIFFSGAYARDFLRWYDNYTEDYKDWCDDPTPHDDEALLEFIWYALDRLWYMDEFIDNIAYEFGL